MEYLGLVNSNLSPTSSSSPCPRRAHAAAQSLGNDHLILIHGGQAMNSTLLHNMWQYDTRRHIWSQIRYSQKSSYPVGRTMHSFISYSPGKFLLYGGYALGNREELDDCWTFDIQDNLWTQIPNIGMVPGKRGGHMAVLGPGAMFLRGGQDGGDNDSVFRLDLRTWKWDKLFISPGAKPVARESPSACWIPQSNCLLMAFGQQLDVEDDDVDKEVFCNDIWALAKAKNREVWYWIKVDLNQKLVGRIGASIVLLPCLKPRVLIWGGLVDRPVNQGFADDYLIIDLDEMVVVNERRPSWPNRMLQSCFRVGSDFFVFGGIQLIAGEDMPAMAPNQFERFRISHEMLYDRKRCDDVRVRVERVDGDGALLSALLDGKIYLAKITNEMIRAGSIASVKQSTQSKKRKSLESQINLPFVSEDVPNQRIVRPSRDGVQSLAEHGGRERRRSGATSGVEFESGRQSAPKRQRVGVNGPPGVVQRTTTQPARNYIGLNSEGSCVETQVGTSVPSTSQSNAASAAPSIPISDTRNNLMSNLSCTTVASPIAMPTKTVQASAIAPPPSRPTPSPIASPIRSVMSSAIAPPPRPISRRQTQVPNSAAISRVNPNSAKVEDGPVEVSLMEQVTPQRPTSAPSDVDGGGEQRRKIAPSSDLGNLDAHGELNQEVASSPDVGNLDSPNAGHMSDIDPEPQGTQGLMSGIVESRTNSQQMSSVPVLDRNESCNGSQDSVEKHRNVGVQNGVTTAQKLEKDAVAPGLVDNPAQLSAIAEPLKGTAVEAIDIAQTGTNMQATDDNVDIMMAAEPLPENIDDLDDLDDELEPINFEPPSMEEQLQPASADEARAVFEVLQTARHTMEDNGGEMEVVEDKQLEEDEIEHVGRPDSGGVGSGGSGDEPVVILLD